MSTLEAAALGLFAISCIGVVTVVGAYPILLWLAGRRSAPALAAARGDDPSISLVVAVRNGADLLEAKVRNSLALRAPGRLELVVVSDGSTDATPERLLAAGRKGVQVVILPEHRGKAAALEAGVRASSGEVLVFSDADALLDPDALLHLVARLADAEVGGVCGQRVIRERADGFEQAQAGYVAADSVVKRLESRVGSVTSNDGKLYAIRRELHRPFAPGATDDLFACLSVIEQGRRFVFEPRARAVVRKPSRCPRHELARRRRIVSRSLHGIALKRGLLNPLRHGGFAVRLLVNKVLRRLLPLFVAGLFASTLALAVDRSWARFVLAVQLAVLALAAVHGRVPPSSRLGAVSSLACYACVGIVGTFLGLVDFVKQRETARWDPIKSG